MNAESLKTPISRFISRSTSNADKCCSPCLKIPASPLLTTLGYGTGVNVYLVERSPRKGHHRSPWALKKINKSIDRNKVYSKRLENEADILKSLDHPNIVGFRALLRSSDGTPCLALEDGQKCLFSIIEERIEDDLGIFPSFNITKVASNIASALCYLHYCKGLLHGDMKSANVLIKGDFDIAKLCDFGVSVELDENMTAPSNKYVGTDSWSSKEALDKGAVVSHKSDMYAYGLTLFEMLTLDMPHFNFPHEDDFDTDEDYNDACAEIETTAASRYGTRPSLPDRQFGKDYHKMIEVFFVCCDEDPAMRPSAAQVKNLLAVEIQRTLTFE